MRRRPVITALGIVSPIGVGVEKFWAAACAGQSGIRTPTLFEASRLPPDCRAVGEGRDFNPVDWRPARIAKMAGRFSQFALAAGNMAPLNAKIATAELPRGQLKASIATSRNGQLILDGSTFAA